MKKSVFPVAVLLLLLWKPAVSLAGAKDGLNLWACVVLPTLLPFMLCSAAVVASGGIPLLTAPFAPFLSRFLGISPSGCYVFLSGLLCGYPMGAKTCADFLSRGMISRQEASYLLAISNHPSPMFLLGYVMAGMEALCPVPLFLLSIYLPILPVAFLASRMYGYGMGSGPGRRRGPGRGDHAAHGNLPAAGSPPLTAEPEGFSFDRDFMGCLESMVRIGGYILVFSIMAAYIRELSPLSSRWNACLLGLTEITTGIHALKQSLDGPSLAAALAFTSSFGGLSGLFQTKSVLNLSREPLSGEQKKNAGLSIRHYVLWKLIYGGLSSLIVTALLHLPAPAALLPR